jgi:hypothetical protein
MEKTYDKLIVGSWTCIEGMFSWKKLNRWGFWAQKKPSQSSTSVPVQLSGESVLLPEASEKVRKNENLTGSSFGR